MGRGIACGWQNLHRNKSSQNSVKLFDNYKLNCSRMSDNVLLTVDDPYILKHLQKIELTFLLSKQIKKYNI